MINRRGFLGLSISGLTATVFSKAAGQKPSSDPGLRVRSPFIVSTWDSGLRANAAGWRILQSGGNALDAVEAAGRAAEDETGCCVGLAAFPDRDGKVTLDACIMNGDGGCGSVLFLDRIAHPVSVARRVMETTPHVILAGEGARQFAVENGFLLESGKLSPDADKEWKRWLEKSKYKPAINIENRRPSSRSSSQAAPYFFDNGTPNHDTMGTIAIDKRGDLAGMVTTSGMAFKMHGRVGDSPIIGAGLFVENEVGAATSSGVGEEVIRICGTHSIIEQMRMGRSPEQACREAVRRIVIRDPLKAKELQVGFVAFSKQGEIAAYSIQPGFSFSVTNGDHTGGKVFVSKSHFGPGA
jgi:N4-(beta-N-acetylglucosaminyl)-L-asparaginase